MLYSEAVTLLNESRLSPEGIAERIALSSSTYRRWLKASARKKLPASYATNVSMGVYRLLGEGLLHHDSARVTDFMRNNLPDFFQAAIAGLQVTPDTFSGDSPHQDKITAVLSHLGNNGDIRRQVDTSFSAIGKFIKWGDSWKRRVRLLTMIVKRKRFPLADKLVAYGALFYLVLPFDLIPDAIPVFGYVDDFGILGFASAYYARRFPAFEAG